MCGQSKIAIQVGEISSWRKPNASHGFLHGQKGDVGWNGMGPTLSRDVPMLGSMECFHVPSGKLT